MLLESVNKYVSMEPYIFFMVLSYSVVGLPIAQLPQDKICLQQLNQTIEYCLIASRSESTPIKLSILSQSNIFTLYVTIMETITGITWCLVTGVICDKHRKLRKLFLILAPFSVLIGNMFTLVNVAWYNELGTNTLMACWVLHNIFGSVRAGFTISYSYIATNSTESNRSIKYFTLEASYIAALAIGNIIGGQVLGMNSWINGDEMRNYSGTLFIGSISAICSIVWVSFCVQDIEESNEIDAILVEGNNNEVEQNSKVKYVDIVKEMFNLKLIYFSFKSALSKHCRTKKSHILILLIAIIFIDVEQLGMSWIVFSYTQRVYRWNYETYSYFSTIATIAGPIVSMIALPMFTKYFKFTDIETAMIGMVSLLVSTISFGSILLPVGYYSKIVLGSLSNMLNSSIRSNISKLIDHDESGKIFAVLIVMEVFGPFIAAVVYTNTFNATILTYPSLVFQISAVTLFIPLILLVYIEFKYERKFL